MSRMKRRANARAQGSRLHLHQVVMAPSKSEGDDEKKLITGSSRYFTVILTVDPGFMVLLNKTDFLMPESHSPRSSIQRRDGEQTVRYMDRRGVARCDGVPRPVFGGARRPETSRLDAHSLLDGVESRALPINKARHWLGSNTPSLSHSRPVVPRPRANCSTRSPSSRVARRSKASRMDFSRADSWNGLRKIANRTCAVCTTSL